MDVLLRTIAVIIEVLLLAVIAFAVLNGVRLTIFDLGLRKKYGRVISMALIAAGIIFIIFFTAHLTTFYPPI